MPSTRTRLFLSAAAVALAAMVSGCSTGNDDDTPRPASASESASAGSATEGLSAGDLETGTCITDSGTAADPAVEVLPCAEAHGFEVFATTELPAGEYPGTGEADAQAQEFCREEFTAFVGVDYDQSELDLQYFYPVEKNWNNDGGRSVACLAGLAGGELSTGTLRGSER
ncbi:hypothetical protein GC088_01940 [Arthrobacter sp. JZ12]|uniref:septum formation family protein n=1 Tax=Arthrobacter sp. JZ12 TaxID=2654190 RepID=UPI002B492A7A|nr:septum formation family protein [Arthrobacter sp. JZ12]WRH23994.1 hypothetical protein GC088_01940 [Arthrobacter sp. JZ12]